MNSCVPRLLNQLPQQPILRIRSTFSTVTRCLLIAFSLFPGAQAASAQQNFSIILTQGLTGTGVSVTAGKKLTISASGNMNWYTGSGCAGCMSDPNGTPFSNSDCSSLSGFAYQGLACWSLVGQIGNGKPFQVGTSYNETVTGSGELYLGVNDNNYPDNTGAWFATINQTGKQQGNCGCNKADPQSTGTNQQNVGSPDDGSGGSTVDPMGNGAGGGGNIGPSGGVSPAGHNAARSAAFSRLPYYSTNLATGNLFYSATDYTTSGQNPLAFTRYYNSRASVSGQPTVGFVLVGAGAGNGPMGAQWRHNYEGYLQLASSTVVAERPDGQQLTFTLTGGAWLPDSDVDMTLIDPGNTWTLTDSNDTAETYTTMDATVALLTSIRSRNGYTQTLAYNSGNQLISVTDSYSRVLSFTYSATGTIATVTTPDGTTITYSLVRPSTTGGYNLTSVTYPTTLSSKIQYTYTNGAQPNQLTGVTDEDNNSYVTWGYGGFSCVISTKTGAGAASAAVAYASGCTTPVTLTNTLGVVDSYTFTTLQGVPKVTGISRAATSTTAAATRSLTYDSNGYLASSTDWNGNLTTYVNDSHGDPTTINEAVGTPVARTTTIAYDPVFVHLPHTITTPGLTVSYAYDSNGNVLTKTLTDTTATTVPYSTGGQVRTTTNTWSNFLLASSKSPNGNTTSFSYDGSGSLVKITNALNQATNITAHTVGGLPETIVDPNNVITTLKYDARQRLTSSSISGSGGTFTTTYTVDLTGNVTKVTLPDNSYLAYTYTAAHLLSNITDALGNSIAYSFDGLYDITQTEALTSSNAVTRKHTATFDVIGRTLTDVGGQGQTTTFTYDKNGNALTVKNGLGNKTTNTFDALNRLSTSTDANSGVAKYAYDAHDRPLTVTDPNNNTTTYTYDGFGDVIQEVSPARGTTVYHYDPDGNLTQKVDARGAIANYTYDALDRVTATTYPADAAENVSYTYDQAAGGFGIGRLTSVTDAAGTLSRAYDERGNVLSESRVQGSGPSTVTLLTKYGYDAASRIASITYPSGNVVAYSRDAVGRIAGIAAQPQGAATPAPVLSKITYQPFGPPNALTYGNGITESRSFDLDYRQTALTGKGNNPVQSLSYGYNAANDVLSIADGVTTGNSQNFGYDTLDRLTSATGGYGALAYTYDANGNRLTENPAVPITLDGLGSVSAFTYNQAGRLASVTAGTLQLTRYTYDAFGHRLAKLGSVTAMTLFQYDIGGHLLEEANAQGNAQADYIYLDGRPVAEFSAGKLYFLHDDRLGTPQMATDTTQANVWVGNYQPFGALSASSQTALLGQDLRLPGQENDIETGLYHNGFRDYAPGVGRYTQSDPIGLRGGMNPYLYANANPGSSTDRMGMATLWQTLHNPEYWSQMYDWAGRVFVWGGSAAAFVDPAAGIPLVLGGACLQAEAALMTNNPNLYQALFELAVDQAFHEPHMSLMLNTLSLEFSMFPSPDLGPPPPLANPCGSDPATCVVPPTYVPPQTNHQ